MTRQKRLSIGIERLDEILQGGLIERVSYWVRSGPEIGKSSLSILTPSSNRRKRLSLI